MLKSLKDPSTKDKLEKRGLQNTGSIWDSPCSLPALPAPAPAELGKMSSEVVFCPAHGNMASILLERRVSTRSVEGSAGLGRTAD